MQTNQQFEQYYHDLCHSCGQSWPQIRQSLSQPTKPVLKLALQHLEQVKQLWLAADLTWQPLDWYPLAVRWPQSRAFPSPLPGFEQGLIYALNPSSILPVLALQLQPDDWVLDACAAPGGKTMLIADQGIDQSHILANDISPRRFHRMRQLFAKHGYSQIKTQRWPAQMLQHKIKQKFDKILLDAPCSSEKHVYNNAKALNQWSAQRIKILSKRQFRLIRSLINLLKPNGRLVYATCALNLAENEQLILQVMKKLSHRLKLVPALSSDLPGQPGVKIHPDFPAKSVVRVWPDQTFDPIFVASFIKIA